MIIEPANVSGLVDARLGVGERVGEVQPNKRRRVGTIADYVKEGKIWRKYQKKISAHHELREKSKEATKEGKKKDKLGLVLTISLQKVAHDPSRFKKTIEDNVKKIEKAGKKKNWSGDPAWGLKVEVNVAEEGII